MHWVEESEQLERELLELREVIRASAPLEQWFERFSELCKRVRDLYIKNYWPTLLDNGNVEAKTEFQQLVSTIYPRLEVLVAECLAAAVNYPNLPSGEPYDLIFAIWKSQQRTTNPQTAQLFGQEQSLVAEYRKILADLRVDSSAGLISLGESLNRRKRSNDPEERASLWKQEAIARLSVATKIDDIALKLVRLRQEIAQQSGFSTYAEYVFNRERRFDFSPSELLQTIRSIHTACNGLSNEFLAFRLSLLGVQRALPWDSECEVQFPSSTTPTQISETSLLSIVSRVFDRLNPDFGAIVRALFEHGAADLWQRKGKQTGAWSTYFSVTGQPVLSTNNTGIPSDLYATFHELGHAVHFSLRVKNRPYWLHQCSNDINEYAAYTIQCLGTRELGKESILHPHELSELNLNTLLNALKCINDLKDQEEFTHWVYSQNANDLTAYDLDRAYLEATMDDGLEWSGYEEFRQKMWHTHRFIPAPFYASEYILAWLMTMLTLEVIDQDPESGMAKFKEILVHSEWGFKRVLSVWGISFPFSHEVLDKISNQLRSEFGFTISG